MLEALTGGPVNGFELSAYAIRHAPAGPAGTRVAVALAERLPCRSGGADLVACMDVLEHLDDGAVALEELRARAQAGRAAPRDGSRLPVALGVARRRGDAPPSLHPHEPAAGDRGGGVHHRALHVLQLVPPAPGRRPAPHAVTAYDRRRRRRGRHVVADRRHDDVRAVAGRALGHPARGPCPVRPLDPRAGTALNGGTLARRAPRPHDVGRFARRAHGLACHDAWRADAPRARTPRRHCATRRALAGHAEGPARRRHVAGLAGMVRDPDAALIHGHSWVTVVGSSGSVGRTRQVTTAPYCHGGCVGPLTGWSVGCRHPVACDDANPREAWATPLAAPATTVDEDSAASTVPHPGAT